MATVADYQIAFSGRTELNAAGFRQQEASFMVPDAGELVLGTARARPLFQMFVLPEVNSRFRVVLNHREIIDTNVFGAVPLLWQAPFMWQDVLGPVAGGTNPVPLLFDLTSGKLTLFQMIVWYQVNI